MAQVRGEPRQPGLDIDAGAVPVEERVHGEAMAQVVEAGPAGSLVGEAGGPDQAKEGEVDILVVEARPGSGHEEGGAPRWAEGPLPQATIRGQRGAR